MKAQRFLYLDPVGENVNMDDDSDDSRIFSTETELWTHDDSDGVVSGIKRPELQINTYQYRDHTQMATPTLFAPIKDVVRSNVPVCILSTAFFFRGFATSNVLCSSCQLSFELPQRIVVEVGNSMPGITRNRQRCHNKQEMFGGFRAIKSYIHIHLQYLGLRLPGIEI